jgi:hypothetical protein
MTVPGRLVQSSNSGRLRVDCTQWNHPAASTHPLGVAEGWGATIQLGLG